MLKYLRTLIVIMRMGEPNIGYSRQVKLSMMNTYKAAHPRAKKS